MRCGSSRDIGVDELDLCIRRVDAESGQSAIGQLRMLRPRLCGMNGPARLARRVRYLRAARSASRDALTTEAGVAASRPSPRGVPSTGLASPVPTRRAGPAATMASVRPSATLRRVLCLRRRASGAHGGGRAGGSTGFARAQSRSGRRTSATKSACERPAHPPR